MADESGEATPGNTGIPMATTTPLASNPSGVVNPTNPHGFTPEQQAQVDRLILAEKASTERNRVKALLSDMGVDKLDDLKTIVQEYRDTKDAARTEVERALARANEETVAAQRERASIATERHSLNVERALMAAGAQGDPAKVARLVEVEVGADAEAVKAAVEAAKADFPSLFGAQTAPLASSEPTGGGAPSRPNHSPDAFAEGKKRAEARNPEGKRSLLP